MLENEPQTGAPEGQVKAEVEAEAREEAQEEQDPMAALSAERDQYKALAQRAQADLINYRRRVEEERAAFARSANHSLLTRLLPILDDMERALEALPSDAPASWSEGVRMIAQNLEALLQSEGVTAYEPAPGDTFDPLEQEAVLQQPTDDHPPGKVVTCVRRGYRTQDRILRAAQVVVAREK